MSLQSLVVTGSLNMDFVVKVERLPAPGETAMGSNFQMIPGGKGANQACVAGKLSRGVRVRMVGRVGLDPFADHLKASLAAAGVDVSTVHSTRQKPTGVALIWVDDGGQNSIVVAPGANDELSVADIEALRAVYADAKCALFQLESPLAAVQAALGGARASGAMTILDPAPARPLSGELLALVDVLTPNESEACLLLNRPPQRINADEAPVIADALRNLGPASVILKLGESGCYYAGEKESFFVPGFRVQAVDATAAGDTFNAAFAVGIAEGHGVAESLRFANAAAAISVTRLGAQSSAPTREDVDDFLAARGSQA